MVCQRGAIRRWHAVPNRRSGRGSGVVVCFPDPRGVLWLSALVPVGLAEV